VVDTSGTGFVLTAEALKRAITPRTRLLLVNSPGNPTGAVWDEAAQRALARVLEGTDIAVISDEIYEKLIYEGTHTAFASLSADAYQRTITVNGVAKAYAMTGWRVGYAGGPAEVIKASSLIRTARGRVILLEHDVVSPRPYSRINAVQGTKGIFEDYPPRIFVEKPGAPHRWNPIDEYRAEHEHPLWRTLGETARSGGHGGMDYVMAWRLVQCMREGLPPDMDVYDAAAWSAPGPLSERSVANRGRSVDFPDFTRGGWRELRRTM
jgi:hypothetical protein